MILMLALKPLLTKVKTDTFHVYWTNQDFHAGGVVLFYLQRPEVFANTTKTFQ